MSFKQITGSFVTLETEMYNKLPRISFCQMLFPSCDVLLVTLKIEAVEHIIESQK